MLKRWKCGSRSWSLLLCLVLVLALVCSCGSKQKVAGTYKAEAIQGGKQVQSVLDLKESGEGSWKVGDDEVNFSWYLKNDELRVNTKGGGVLVGTLENDAIRITLPGFDTLTFKKSQ